MAQLVCWVKTAETAEAVTYRFGKSPETLDGTVSIDPATEAAVQMTGPAGLGSVVVGWTSREHRRTGSWPDRGYTAS